MSAEQPKTFKRRRQTGWDLDLYRNRTKGWIAGVCAGLADHWGIPVWLVRLGTIALFMFTGTLAFWAYIAAVILLAPRPNRWTEGVSRTGAELEYDEEQRRYRKRTVFHYSDAPSARLRKARERLDEAQKRIESMERYITSKRCDLNQEFSKL